MSLIPIRSHWLTTSTELDTDRMRDENIDAIVVELQAEQSRRHTYRARVEELEGLLCEAWRAMNRAQLEGGYNTAVDVAEFRAVEGRLRTALEGKP